MVKLFKRLRGSIFSRVVLLTLLSIAPFIIFSIIDVFFLWKNPNLAGDNSYLVVIGISLFIIAIDLLIARKWLSLKEVGLHKSGFLKSLFYSLIFVFLFKFSDFSNHGLIFNKSIVWNKTFLLHSSTFIFLAFQEELMFRGLIFKIWEKRKGFMMALAISSILFGLEHWVYPAMGCGDFTVVSFISRFSMGLTFALIAYRSRNIWGLFISHLLYNWISLLSVVNPNPRAVTNKLATLALSLGVIIFSPIIIDLLDKFLSKTKPTPINWRIYLVTLSVVAFIIFLAMAV